MKPNEMPANTPNAGKPKGPAGAVDSAGGDRLFAEERKIRIMEELAAHRKIRVQPMARLLGVSDATVRTYLRDLERAGALIRTHGGAVARTTTGFELTSRQKEIQHLAEKRRIARMALGLVEDGDTIILDTGTTTLELARCLHERKRLTVVTNDLLIAQVLEDAESAQVLLLGGVVRKGFHCTIGIQGGAFAEGLAADKAFMATNGFTAAGGATTPDIHQAETKKRMIGIATRVILLCDHSKIGTVSFARFAAADQIDVLITDRVDELEKQDMEDRGIAVLTATAAGSDTRAGTPGASSPA